MREDLVSEALRLERLWSGPFGNEYLHRNRGVGKNRARFWRKLLDQYPARRVLEVGCNVGGNLRWINAQAPLPEVYGVDVNLQAVDELRHALPRVHALAGSGRELPFPDRSFDLVFTMGVLIHQPETTLPIVMAEVVRCSRRYVLAGEYHSDESTEIPYRGQRGALFKRDYGRLYQELFPELELRSYGLLGREDGFDDMTYWLFERRGPQ